MFFKSNIKIFKPISVSVIAVVTIFAALIVPAYAQADFDAFMGNSIPDIEIDGNIGSEWDDAGNYPNSQMEPTGIAEIWTKHDGTYLYIAIEFTADSSNPWVGIQFEQASHMSSGADGAIFGHDRIGANEYRDISFGGLGSISSDANQNGVGAINLGSENLVTIELKKPLSSGDSAGGDIDWSVDQSYTLVILWDSNGGGSSGGSSSHISSSQVNRTVFINPNVIPEFTTLTFSLTLVATATLFLILRRKQASVKS